MNSFNFISCPYCGYQYAPGEIYSPNHFIGQPKDIVRNNIGEILGHEGIPMNTTESYICDCCNKEFTVTAKVTFIYDVDETEIPKIKTPSLFE